MRLEGKVAIVTGGGSGIGQGIALAYAREGANIVVADLNLQGAQETISSIKHVGREGLAIQTDVAESTQVQAMVNSSLAAFGKIDVLVNVAGIMNACSVLDTTVEQWDRTLNVNLRGTFLCMQAVAREMIAQGYGSIINTTSILGRNARPKRAAYCASKAGIILLTQTAAMEFGPHGIRVNAIAPGSIETPLVRSAPISQDALARKVAAIPLRRRGDPADLTGPAIFLACDESNYVTGDILTVDGGMTAGIE
jgi:NAD(P)-dependent dehydrogenase (short-subunit alcohol dehydrogenase family)